MQLVMGGCYLEAILFYIAVSGSIVEDDVVGFVCCCADDVKFGAADFLEEGLKDGCGGAFFFGIVYGDDPGGGLGVFGELDLGLCIGDNNKRQDTGEYFGRWHMQWDLVYKYKWFEAVEMWVVNIVEGLGNLSRFHAKRQRWQRVRRKVARRGAGFAERKRYF